MAKLIKDYMTPMPHTVGEDIPVQRAQEMMAEIRCHHLPVLKGGHLCGVISARDIQIAEGFQDLELVKVNALMSEEPFVVQPTETVKQVVDKMLSTGCGSAIISASKTNSWGIFTTNDALKLLSEVI